MSQAQDAKKVTEYLSAEEKVKVEVMGSYGISGELELSKLVENLGHVGTVTKVTFPVEVTVDGKSFTIGETGVVGKPIQTINTNNLKVTTVANKETEITKTSINKPEEGTPLEIIFDVSISEGTITGVNKGTLVDGEVTYDTDGTETEVTFTFTLSGLEDNTPQTVTIKNLRNYYNIKLYGVEVKLNGGSDITVGNGTIKDNWKLFYIDDNEKGYVNLIYGEYYPASVQTDPDTNINSVWIGTQSFPFSVNQVGAENRLYLLKYLKNSLNYNSESNLDNNSTKGGFKSWNDLLTSLTSTGKILENKTIEIQGAPNITMWIQSWNEQGYTKLALDDAGNTAIGYNIRLNSAVANSNDDYKIDLSSYSGYNDTLYFPYKGIIEGNIKEYWLASPGGGSEYSMCRVSCKTGFIDCILWGDYSTQTCARPVISILKNDFRTLFPNIYIDKRRIINNKKNVFKTIIFREKIVHLCILKTAGSIDFWF